MRPIDDIAALDPSDPADAAIAIEAADQEIRENVTADRRAAQIRANDRTAVPANALKLARGQ